MFKFAVCPLPPFSRVWLYLRDSGGDNQDLASQRAYGMAFCEHHQFQIVRVFEDGAVSGGSTKGRDEFQAMVDLARNSKAPLVDGILYWDTKRFARNQLDSQFYKADLRRRGYKLVSLSDDIPDNDFAPMIESFLEWKAQKDRSDLSKDVARGMAYIVGLRDGQGNYLGIFPGATPTFFRGVPYNTGIKRNDGSVRIVQRIIPDEDLWPLGQRMMQMRADRASYQEIEAELNLFPRNKAPSSTYYHIFRNEIYIGRLRYSGQIYEGFVPALASPEQWERIQSLNYERPRADATFPAGKLHPKAGRGTFLLSGLCRCAYCHSPIHGSTNRRKERKTAWRYYVCSTKEGRPKNCPESKRLPAASIEPALIEAVMSRVLTADYIQRLTEQVNSLLGNSDAIHVEIERQQRKLAELKRIVNTLIDTIEIAPNPDLLARLKQRQVERDGLERKLLQLQEQMARNYHLVDEKRVLQVLIDMKKTLTEGEIRARQLVLRSFVVKMELGRASGLIYYRFPLAEVYFERVRGIELNPVQVLEFQY